MTTFDVRQIGKILTSGHSTFRRCSGMFGVCWIGPREISPRETWEPSNSMNLVPPQSIVHTICNGQKFRAPGVSFIGLKDPDDGDSLGLRSIGPPKVERTYACQFCGSVVPSCLTHTISYPMSHDTSTPGRWSLHKVAWWPRIARSAREDSPLSTW